jgi:phosphatidylglycerophosphatase B
MLPALALLPLTHFEPTLNPYVAPHFDLTGSLAWLAYFLATSGGTSGIPWIGIGMTALLVSRPAVPRGRRLLEIALVVCTLLLVLGCGASINEHIVKPRFHIPRPNILELAGTPPEKPLLAMSAEQFYALPDKATRSEHLKAVLAGSSWLHPFVRAHWIAETGFSFPSGHSFSSMLFATFFLALGLAYAPRNRRWCFLLLVPWAVAVCYSRPILRVHSPTDICVGGLEGFLIGCLAFLVVREILRRADLASSREQPGVAIQRETIEAPSRSANA